MVSSSFIEGIVVFLIMMVGLGYVAVLEANSLAKFFFNREHGRWCDEVACYKNILSI